jgi:hypothetical protein
MSRSNRGKNQLPSEFSNGLQAQLLSGRGKPRVWFAERDELQWVVKGPVCEKERDGCMNSQRFKEILGLPHTALRCETINGSDYLVQRSLIDYTKLERQTATTSFESNVVVPKETHIAPWRDEMLHEMPELAQPMLEALLFRKIIGANDTCRWNVMVIPDKSGKPTVYSIDDAAQPGRTTPLMWKLKADPSEFGAALDRCWDNLMQTMEYWEAVLKYQPKGDPLAQFALQQLAIYKNRRAWRWK